MSQATSPSVGIPYGLTRVCRVWKIPRSTVYFRRGNASSNKVYSGKRGPKVSISDRELLHAIRKAVRESPWNGEGYRKVWARLRAKGVRVSMKRVLRTMRERKLLAKDRPIRRGHSREHKGSIIKVVSYLICLTSCGEQMQLSHSLRKVRLPYSS